MAVSAITTFVLLKFVVPFYRRHYDIPTPCYQAGQTEYVPPFVVSEYLQRMEDHHIRDLTERGETDWTVTLWWGLDGLQIAEDGSAKWVRRGIDKPSPLEDWSDLPHCSCVSSGVMGFGGMTMLYADNTIAAMSQRDAMQTMNIAAQLAHKQAQLQLQYQQAQLAQTFFAAMQNCSVIPQPAILPAISKVYGGP